MKTLVFQKIEEEKESILNKIKHRALQMNKDDISFGEFILWKDRYKAEFESYVKSFYDIEILTYDDYEMILKKFLYDVVKLKSKIK